MKRRSRKRKPISTDTESPSASASASSSSVVASSSVTTRPPLLRGKRISTPTSVTSTDAIAVSSSASSSSSSSSSSSTVITAISKSGVEDKFKPIQFDTSETVKWSLWPLPLHKGQLRSKETLRNWLAKIQQCTSDSLYITGVLEIIAGYAPHDYWIFLSWNVTQTLRPREMLIELLEYTRDEKDFSLLENVAKDDDLIREHLHIGDGFLSLPSIWNIQRFLLAPDTQLPLSIALLYLLQRANVLSFEIPNNEPTVDDYGPESEEIRRMELSAMVLSRVLRECRHDIVEWVLFDNTDQRRWHFERLVNFSVVDFFDDDPSYRPGLAYELKLRNFLPEQHPPFDYSYSFARTWRLLEKAGVYSWYTYRQLHPIAMMLDKAVDEYAVTQNFKGQICVTVYEVYGYPKHLTPKQLLDEFWDPNAPIWPPEEEDEDEDNENGNNAMNDNELPALSQETVAYP